MALSAHSTHSKNPKTSGLQPLNMIDIHGIARADCENCTECPQFVSIPGHVLCAYCGCPPARHVKKESHLDSTLEQESCDTEGGDTNFSDESSLVSMEMSDSESSTSSGISSLGSGRRRRVKWRPRVEWTSPPPRVSRLLDQAPVPRDIELENTWSNKARSCNIILKEGDPLTFHRNPVYQTTDAIRGKRGYDSGLHIWEIRWPCELRGTHPVVGVATRSCPLQEAGYKRLVGSNPTSWGWCLKTMKLYHDSRKYRDGLRYPSNLETNLKVPDVFFMILDMDRGTLSFQVEDDFLGVAFSGLRCMELFPIASAVWGHCEVTLRYVGSHQFDS